MREFRKLVWYVYTIGNFNLWKYGEGMDLFMIIRYIVRETWFTKIDNLELDTNKKLLCFVEIQLPLLKKLPNSVQKQRIFRVMLLFLNLFLEFKDMRNSSCELI